jgi:hypothetical protein
LRISCTKKRLPAEIRAIKYVPLVITVGNKVPEYLHREPIVLQLFPGEAFLLHVFLLEALFF